jgi:hypothetical protein
MTEELKSMVVWKRTKERTWWTSITEQDWAVMSN